MKKISHFKKTLFILGIGIAPFNGHVYAANEIANTIADNKEAQFESAEVTAIKLNELKGGALNYFSENDAWPLNVTDLATNGFYYGSYDTMYGTSISGAIVGGSYVLSVDVLDQSLATYISNFVNGTAAGSVVSVQFGAPSTLAILDSVISRVDNGDPSRNTMETDLRLGGNDLVGVNKVDANVVNSTQGNFNDVQSDTGTITSLSVDSITGNTGNLTTVNSTTVNTTNVTATGVANLGQVSASSVSATQVTGTNGVYDSGARVFSPVNLPTKNDVGLDRVQNYSITDSYTGNSSTLYASQKAVTQAYTKLNNEKLDKNAKAVDADKLDGIESSSFIRSDVNDYVNANTQWQDGRRVRFGSGADSEAFYDGSNFYLRNLNNGNIYIDNRRNNGDVVLRADNASGSTLDAVRVVGSDNVSVRLSQGGTERLRTTSFGVNVNGQIEADRVTVNGADVWTSSNDGSGSGVSADNLDGFNSSQFIRSDANQNVTANTEWQDNNEIRLGASADIRMVHNGSDSYITNYTGSFFVQNAANGGELVFRGRDSSGTIQEAIRVTTGTDEVAAVLSQNGNNKLRTRSYGAEVFGRLEADQITVNGSNVWTAANDGSGSGLSADNLDGINSSQFLRVDQDDNIAANTEWQDNYSARFGNSADLRILHTGSTSHISNYTGELITENRAHGGDMVFRSENTGGTLREAMRVVADGNVFVRLAYDSSERLKTTSYGVEVTGRVEADQLTVNGSNVWTAANDGSGSGLDADKFDGLNSTQFLRTDTNDVVNGHTEWQDNYSVRLGSSADMRMYHNGSHSYIDNYTNNLYLRNIKESAGILMEATAGNGNRYRGIAIHTDSNNVWGRLYSNGNARVDATRDGATIYGDVTVTGGDIYLAGKRLQNNSGNLYWDGKQVATLNGGGWSSSENRVAYTGTDGVMEVGRIVDFHATANSSRDYDMRFWASADELVLWGGDMTVRDGGMNISGDYKVNGRKIDKAYIGLDRVMNFSITNSYTGNSSSLYASQQAVTQAYNKLNNDKLDKNAKAADADKLDGIDSSLFVRTSRKINGKSLTSDITLSKSDIGLSKVDNFDSTNSYTGRATNLFVTQRALNDAYKDAISKLSPDRTYFQLFFRSGGLDKGTIFLERSWKGFEEIVVFAGPDNQNDLFVTRFTEKEYQLAEASWSYFGRPATEFKFHIISHHHNFWSGNFYSDVAFMTADENARIYAIYGVGR